ncbi:NADH-quinone oxidoreductase subunit L|uniref:NADH-quinone oxidoreductase subunit L n=1 Tax=Noviherbaspirillum sp. L7-7A TaxID=2850560 RepID=UPI001C2C4D73|nr:NADH-quinone oxidoreductase subunit L [Noviherbaspirillum sp. L7-7A]MBV0878271.1 NADH-quinone oxidoreductase subunit L [Noviherbaspirillum sp. L7-7A]
MMHPDVAAWLWLMPLAYALALVPALAGVGETRAWRFAEASAAGALGVAVCAVAVAAAQAATGHVAIDAPGLAMACLISLLSWVILRFSRRYLQGEPGQRGYIAAMLFTLASVSVVFITDHLGVLALAWLSSSLGLHRLLMFYADRPVACVVAHKKFLASRLADLSLALALWLIYSEAGTLSMQGIAAHVAASAKLAPSMHAAMALIALAVIFKSAQLPVHGWLIQVMEAPTPVSALLHAGVVNLGGFVLIRLAALLSAAPVAQAMLVIVGSLTAVLAGLVMMTRISIKVRLAWSTCAQMGFMLLECGLGLYELALLHLLAHSLYKAYAFLTAGEAVMDTRRRQLFPNSVGAAPMHLFLGRLAAAPLAMAAVWLSTFMWQLVSPHAQVPAIVVLIIGLGLAPLLWQDKLSGMLRGLLAVLLLAQLYVGWHLLFATLLALPDSQVASFLVAWVAICFALLYGVQAWLLAFPGGRLSVALYPWAYAGFYLDERFTRLTFRIWPVQLPQRPPHQFNVATGEQA